jgi:hypothetical protein
MRITALVVNVISYLSAFILAVFSAFVMFKAYQDIRPESCEALATSLCLLRELVITVVMVTLYLSSAYLLIRMGKKQALNSASEPMIAIFKTMGVSCAVLVAGVFLLFPWLVVY